MTRALSIPLPDESATQGLGHRLANVLFPNAVIALVGTLGAGKTYLVRSIAQGLGVSARELVTSPTFVLIQEYGGRLPIYHFDAYRLRSPREFFELGASEYFESGGVCLVEWADRVVDHLPADHLKILLTVTGERSRTAQIDSFGPAHEAVLAGLT